MAGYCYERGMSNNAVFAYECGRKPISKFTKSDLLTHEIDLTLDFVKWLAKKNIWETSEYHHTGGTWYNSTYFYDLEDLRELISNDDFNLSELLCEFQKEKNDKKQTKNDLLPRVSGKYPVWGGSRSRPKILYYESFNGVKSGFLGGILYYIFVSPKYDDYGFKKNDEEE